MMALSLLAPLSFLIQIYYSKALEHFRALIFIDLPNTFLSLTQLQSFKLLDYSERHQLSKNAQATSSGEWYLVLSLVLDSLFGYHPLPDTAPTFQAEEYSNGRQETRPTLFPKPGWGKLAEGEIPFITGLVGVIPLLLFTMGWLLYDLVIALPFGLTTPQRAFSRFLKFLGRGVIGSLAHSFFELLRAGCTVPLQLLSIVMWGVYYLRDMVFLIKKEPNLQSNPNNPQQSSERSSPRSPTDSENSEMLRTPSPVKQEVTLARVSGLADLCEVAIREMEENPNRSLSIHSDLSNSWDFCLNTGRVTGGKIF